MKVKTPFNSIEFNFFNLAREIITDDELKHLADRYHHRHPTFTIDIQERTCRTLIIACVYHYRHVEINIRCQSIYNERFNRFDYHWSTDQIEYQEILNEIFDRLHTLHANRSMDDQIETIIEDITKYFTRLKPINEERVIVYPEKDSTSIEIVQYDRSPRSRRRQCLERSLSWSQPLNRRPMLNFNRYGKRV